MPVNLPSPYTSFFGRVDEVERLAAHITAHRSVTLVGHRGVGASCLSNEAVVAVSDEFRDGVWFVELAWFALQRRSAGPLAEADRMA